MNYLNSGMKFAAVVAKWPISGVCDIGKRGQACPISESACARSGPTSRPSLTLRRTQAYSPQHLSNCSPWPSPLRVPPRRRLDVFRTTVFLSQLRTCALATTLSLVVAAVGFAQSATGSIEGTVVDTSGAVLPGVTVTLTNSETGAARTVTTDPNGLFAVPLLPVGIYEVAAELAGF